MVSLQFLVVASLLVCGSSAIDIGKLLGGGGEEKEAAQPEKRQFIEQMQRLGEALNPMNLVSAALNALPGPMTTSPARNTVTKTIYIQVTSTLKRHPVCMTAYGVKPPCAQLSHPHLPLHYGEEHAQSVSEHDAYYLGQGVGVHGSDLLQNPALGYVGQVPAPHDHHDDEDDAWERSDDLESFEIEPTAAVRMVEATATYDNPRDKRDVSSVTEIESSPVTDLESSVVAETPNPEPLRPHPRFLAVAVPNPVTTVTKTHYMTKIEKVTDHHVTATLVAQNCIPEHIPFCPSNPVIVPTAVPYPEHHTVVPAYTPAQAVPQHYQPAQQAQPIRPGHWNYKNNIDKIDIENGPANIAA